ncbi:hypothetical protein A0123_03225 [Gluconobacter cerinus]|uniref:Uncharacterized protein n=1 Tax=Gluconobacter cerinus TaxID=38307 RepID=A0A1B6VGA3_9PROT|nr:hypothetical protein A0123_03225 [Gluconobacter cerinus]
MVKGNQTLLCVHARPHCRTRADQDAFAPGIEIPEQSLLGRTLFVMLHEGDLLARHAHPHQLVADPQIGREAPFLQRGFRTQIREDHLHGPGQIIRLAGVGIGVAVFARRLPDVEDPRDHDVQLVAGVVVFPGSDKAQINRRVTRIVDHGQDDILTLLRLALALLDHLDPRFQLLLVIAKGGSAVCDDDLSAARGDFRQLHILPQVVLLHDVREMPVHGHQIGHVHELRKPRHRLVQPARLKLEFRAGLPEIGGPRIELMQATLDQGVDLLEALHIVHLAQGVRNRRARGHHQLATEVEAAQIAGLDVQVPGTPAAVRIHPFEAGLVRTEAELAELLRFIHEDLVDPDLAKMHQIVLAAGQPLQFGLHPFLHTLDALARDAVVLVHIAQQALVRRDLRLDHRLLEPGLDRNELEGIMRDDDRVPLTRGRTGEKALALRLHEVRLVRHQDLRGRVEHQELAGHLRQTMSRHHHHGLRDQAETALLHDRRAHREGFPRPHGMGHVSVARGNDAPDHPLLVGTQLDRGAGPGQQQMRAVKGAGDEVVVGVVIQPHQTLGALWILPHPGLEGRLDGGELFLGGLGLLRIQLPVLTVLVAPGVPDLRNGLIERILDQFACGTAFGAPDGRRFGLAPERSLVQGPGRHLFGVPHAGFDPDHLGDEALDVGGRNPRRAQTGCNVTRPQILGLGLFQRGHGAGKAGIGLSGLAGVCQLRAYGP